MLLTLYFTDIEKKFFYEIFFHSPFWYALKEVLKKKKIFFTGGIARGKMFLRRNIENTKKFCSSGGTLRIIYIIFSMYTVGKKSFDAQLSVIFLLTISDHVLNIDISIFTQHKRAKYRYQNILV